MRPTVAPTAKHGNARTPLSHQIHRWCGADAAPSTALPLKDGKMAADCRWSAVPRLPISVSSSIGGAPVGASGGHALDKAQVGAGADVRGDWNARAVPLVDRGSPHHAAPRRTTPRHASPRRATPRHASPRRITPRRESRDVGALGLAPRVGYRSGLPLIQLYSSTPGNQSTELSSCAAMMKVSSRESPRP